MEIVVKFSNFDEMEQFAAQIAAKDKPQYVAADAIPAVVTPAIVPAAPAAEPAVLVIPEPETASASAPMQAPAPVRKVTRQEVQAKAIALMDQGRQEDLMALLAKYQVSALPDIREDQLPAFMADLEVL